MKKIKAYLKFTMAITSCYLPLPLLYIDEHHCNFDFILNTDGLWLRLLFYLGYVFVFYSAMYLLYSTARLFLRKIPALKQAVIQKLNIILYLMSILYVLFIYATIQLFMSC